MDHFDDLIKIAPEHRNSENLAEPVTVNSLKGILENLNKEYKTTLIFETEDSSEIYPIVISPHRVGTKINLNIDLPEEKLTELKHEYYSANLKYLNNDKGVKFKYLPSEESSVDLFVGCFGTKPEILWVSSDNPEKVNAVLENIDFIKTISLFKDVKKIQCPELDYSKLDKEDELNTKLNNELTPLFSRTTDLKRIYEKKL